EETSPDGQADRDHDHVETRRDAASDGAEVSEAIVEELAILFGIARNGAPVRQCAGTRRVHDSARENRANSGRVHVHFASLRSVAPRSPRPPSLWPFRESPDEVHGPRVDALPTAQARSFCLGRGLYFSPISRLASRRLTWRT